MQILIEVTEVGVRLHTDLSPGQTASILEAALRTVRSAKPDPSGIVFPTAEETKVLLSAR